MAFPPPPPPPPPPVGAPAAPPPPPTAANGHAHEVRAQVESVRQVMAANVEAVLERGERLDALEGKTEGLSSTAAQFQRQGAALRRRMWLNSVKTKLFAGLAVGLVLVAVFSVACFMGGRNCLGGGSDAVVAAAPGGAGEDGLAATILPDGSPAFVGTPLPTVAPPVGGRPAADAPGVLTTEEAAAVLSAGVVGRRRRR